MAKNESENLTCKNISGTWSVGEFLKESDS
jgi:hypothetical protein